MRLRRWSQDPDQCAVNPHRVEGGYNGIQCDRSDRSASLRHFFGTDVKKAITEPGHFNGRSRELELVRGIADAAISTFGPARESTSSTGIERSRPCLAHGCKSTVDLGTGKFTHEGASDRRAPTALAHFRASSDRL